MLKFYGNPEPGGALHQIRPGGVCPHCGEGARYRQVTVPVDNEIQRDQVKELVVSYFCDHCLGPIPIQWTVNGWGKDGMHVHSPRLLLRSRAPYNFEHVPDQVKREIEEALDCLSVNALHGFAVCCRRAVQAICTKLGAQATSKVKAQIREMCALESVGDEIEELAIQVMLSGHDGAHPHLPEVSEDRAGLLLALLQDLTGQLFTRPGRIRAAAALRVTESARRDA